MTNHCKKSFFKANGLALVLSALALPAQVFIANPVSAATVTFSNSAAISIPNSGPANPYPSSINVSGLTGLTTKVTVTLFDMSHTFPDDIDILLVDPTGLKTLLMADTGGGSDITNVTLAFDDAASSLLPDVSLITSGSYRPSNFGAAADVFAAPAPAGPYAANPLSVFNSVNPNGLWSLYVVDDLSGDAGSIAGGWSLTITDDAPAPTVPEPSLLLLFSTGFLSLAARRWRQPA